MGIVCPIVSSGTNFVQCHPSCKFLDGGKCMFVVGIKSIQDLNQNLANIHKVLESKASE